MTINRHKRKIVKRLRLALNQELIRISHNHDCIEWGPRLNLVCCLLCKMLNREIDHRGRSYSPYVLAASAILKQSGVIPPESGVLDPEKEIIKIIGTKKFKNKLIQEFKSLFPGIRKKCKHCEATISFIGNGSYLKDFIQKYKKYELECPKCGEYMAFNVKDIELRSQVKS